MTTKRTVPYIFARDEWSPAEVYTHRGQWLPAQVEIPVTSIHREDPIPYAMPTARPWNPPVPCRVPTYDGSDRTTHPGVVDFYHEDIPGGKFGGYRFWMVHTPYPNDDSRLENPSISVSNNGWDWHDPMGIINPVVAEPPRNPSTYFNADGDLAWNPDLHRMELIWKHQEIENNTVEWRHSYSYNGISWSAESTIQVTEGSDPPGWGYVSAGMARVHPSLWKIVLIRDSGQLCTYTAPTPSGPWDGAVDGDMVGASFAAGEYAWHPDIIFDGDTYWMLVSSRSTVTNIYPARSRDGVDWVFGPAVLLDEPGSQDSFKYRPTLALHENGTHMRVWYGERGTMSIRYTMIPLSEWPDLP